jgi:multicomponent Na+:H+ antiporter subunit E
VIQAFLLHIFLTLVYVFLTGNTSTPNVLIGFVIGFVVLTFYGLATRGPSYAGKVYRLVRFSLYFLKILTQANLKIAWECITPDLHQRPRIIRYCVKDLNDVQLTVLANCITLTPGTLVVDVSDDHDWLYIHSMYAQDREAAILEIQGLDDRLRREVFQ